MSGRAIFQGILRSNQLFARRDLLSTAHDFFTHQPVQNAAVFLLRVITHDWADEFVTRILLQLRHAATPSTKLIIVDYILPFACEDDGKDAWIVKTLAPPGSGLLPNLGKASANAFWLDMTASSVTIADSFVLTAVLCRCASPSTVKRELCEK
jgi:hypothetical protein